MWKRLSWLMLGWGLAAPGLAEVMPVPDVTVGPAGRHLVLNLPQARLFLYQDGKLARIFPVAVGKMLTQTPIGSFDITGIYKAPAWHVPKSIQDEMKRNGKPVQTVVPPGPDNPLGPVFVRFGESKLGLGFHGTNAPASVPGFRSHGCVRMKNNDALELAGTVSRGDAVTVAYQTILLNEDQNGDLWLTIYRNHYKQDDPSMPYLAQTLLDWQRQHRIALYGKRVDDALKSRNGKPVCLSCKKAVAGINGELTAVPWLSHLNLPQPLPASGPVEDERQPGPPLSQRGRAGVKAG
ncbi:L,D-transpeptidase [Chromobacterium sp. IIBBL 290-4]|uniref:L,D-transpeptidase n=1 Tax=Chromobacterium sp. IIBBL 290-4 TaxID=2953890 RepID=UPI0020B69F32|nr:L,D-transpeptidase [Chromobacterium sp. IIBBL 290-4]UTH74143.1 L,D-transpeptidase [Chromobacterium sp. IIBBL 290-4]